MLLNLIRKFSLVKKRNQLHVYQCHLNFWENENEKHFISRTQLQSGIIFFATIFQTLDIIDIILRYVIIKSIIEL